MLDEATARKYAAVWAKTVGANVEDLKKTAGGDFFGELGSLGFEYLARQKTLAVRAYIQPNDAELTSKEDLLPWLNRIAVEQPSSVSHGMFETCKAPWEPDEEPSLFLRIELRDASLSESAVVARLMKFRDDAIVWSRNKLTEALDGLVKERRQRKVP